MSNLIGHCRDGTPVRSDSDRAIVAAWELEQEQDRAEQLNPLRRNGVEVDDPYADVPPPNEPPDDRSTRPNRTNGQPVSLLGGMLSAAQLDRMQFDPLVEHVPHLVVEGFGILAGPPKVGKSWLAGGIALGCAQGGTVLGGISVDSRHVLLLALEDGPRRLQSRMRRLNYGQPLPDRLKILTKVTPGTVHATIAEWLELHSGDEVPPLVVLDTLGKARPQRRAGDDPYIADYQLGGSLKDLIDAVPGAALLVVHHTRKMRADDWLDTLSGTQGIAGSADYVLVLARKRQSAEGVLAVTGRDIAENEYAVKTDDGIWSLDGMDALDAAATVTTRAERDQQSRLSDRSRDTLSFVNSRPFGTRAADLADHLGVNEETAGRYLRRLHEMERIGKLGRGVYKTLSGVSGVSGSDETAGEGDQHKDTQPDTPLSGVSGSDETANPADQHKDTQPDTPDTPDTLFNRWER